MKGPTGKLAMLTGAVLLAATVRPGAAAGQFDRPRFAAQPPFTVDVGNDIGRQAMALADLDGDERPDLAVIEPDNNRIDVFLNRGDGSFDLVTTPGLEDFVTPSAVAIADVGSPFTSETAGRPDGRPDLIVGGDDGEVVLVFGRGDGTFDPEQAVTEPFSTASIRGLAVGDFEPGNGLDVALLDDGGVVLLCNAGVALFAECSDGDPLEAGLDPRAIVSGDFNGDGRRDVAVLDGEDRLVWPFFGGSDPLLAPGHAVDATGDAESGEAVDLAVGRIDGDAIDDIVVANSDVFGQLFGATLFGTTRGAFRTRFFVLDFRATAIVLGDFDVRDGYDVIAGYSGDPHGALTVNLGVVDEPFADPFTPLGVTKVGSVGLLLPGDIDGDGFADLLVLDGDGRQVQPLLNRSVAPCAGDCDHTGKVSVSELIHGVNILLGRSDAGGCVALDGDRSGSITVEELVAAVATALDGCPAL